MRDIKFRIVNTINNTIDYFNLDNNFDCHSGWLENCILNQFTGLKDKNGVDIYEGDIINHKDYKGYPSEKWEIIFYSGSFWISGLPRKIRIYNIGDRLDSIEIIGNIYSNTELINN